MEVKCSAQQIGPAELENYGLIPSWSNWARLVPVDLDKARLQA